MEVAKLNPANGNFLNEFRMKEGVDISYTKTRGIDNNPYNKTIPDSNQFLIYWLHNAWRMDKLYGPGK